MDVIYITTCTNRKRRLAKSVLNVENLPYGTQEQVTRCWIEHINLAEKIAEAQDFYCGRGFTECLTVSKIVNADPWIISAGLGLVHASERIPSYDLTISSSARVCIQKKVITSFCSSSWWRDLNKDKGRSLAKLVNDHPSSIVLLSLSQSYARMVQDDLLQLDDLSLNRLRIMGLLSSEILASRLRGVYMPYDARLNDPQMGIPGTMSDFPQRSTRHFVERIWSKYPSLGAFEHAALVEKSLSVMKQPLIPVRKQMTDEQIKQVIAKHWDHAEGHASKMLQHLRKKLIIACEQRRFSLLFRQVKEGKKRG